MDLVSAVVDARSALVAVVVGEDGVVGHAERAVDLDRTVDRGGERLGGEELDERDLLARGVSAFGLHFPRGVEDHQARRVDLGACLGDEVLDHLLGAERLSGRDFARGCAGAHEVEGALGDADPAHRVMDPAGAEALLRDEEARALRAE